ncbi:uncharacterized protein DNG_07432 [Cephalotrichum gorgonifer]|uniref:Uncharacterized protein n=1 Tax=Cephalotrichum gorgonifer TaxID=2041049 RepID=A0AAE8N2E0_9PEZI|nr:uncharacterized protein DNG_07432 [Cephalotrichum gorgonifer]
MKVARWIFLAPVPGLIAFASAEDVVYVTDLTIFTLLAPCAQYAVSDVIQGKTYTSCGEAVTELQSCVCSKNNNHNDILTSISSSISYQCGSTASDDHASATAVFNKYCDPATSIDFPTPTKNVVEQYPTDLPAYHDLAPCAQYGVSLGMQEMTATYCPEPASLLAPCICGKNQNSLKASQTINSSVKYSCSNNDDISSAQGFLAAYCAMTAGTTSFPEPSMPPGDMTYYISALPQYSALAPCAQSAVDMGLYSHSNDFCPEGPRAFAGCACTKSGLSSKATSWISENVKYSCDSTATDDVSSALSVWAFYCSAAAGEVTASGVTESIDQPSRTNSGPKETGSGAGSDSGDDEAAGIGSSKPPVGTIAGGVIAGVAVLGIIGVAIWYFRRRKTLQQRNEAGASAAAGAAGGGDPGFGKPELAGSVIAGAGAGAGHSGFVKPELAGNAVGAPLPPPSPASTKSGWSPLPGNGNFTPSPPPPVPELQGHGYGPTPELHGVQTGSPRQELPGGVAYGVAPPSPNRPELGAGPQGYTYAQELQGHPQNPHGYPGQGAPGQQPSYQQPGYQHQPGYQQPQPPQQGYFPPGQQQSPAVELQTMSWQAGPVQGYHEMPTQFHNR